MSFSSPRISGRFFRGPRVRVPEDDERSKDACNSTSRGRAVGRMGIYVLAFEECKKKRSREGEYIDNAKTL